MSETADLSELRTPCAVVDLGVVERNCASMAARAARWGVRLRPHVKTHATVEAARLQTAGQFGGITVSTLGEARGLAAAGFRDLTWAVPFSESSLPAAVELAGGVDRLGLLVDTPEAVAALRCAARASRRRLAAWLEIDCGDHRTGVDPDDPSSARLAAELAGSEELDFRGLLTHAGHAYRCRDREELRRVAAQERDVTVAFAERLRADGVAVPEVSIGSTPTLSVVDHLSGVTEIRPGNHVFHDVFQATIGSCGPTNLAFSVLASVISSHPGRVVLDAGALALSKDAGATHVEPDPGFGRLARADGTPLEGWRVVSLSQEHGVAQGPGSSPRWGERLRVLPNHSCLAAACHRSYRVVRGTEVVGEWQTFRGWD